MELELSGTETQGSRGLGGVIPQHALNPHRAAEPGAEIITAAFGPEVRLIVTSEGGIVIL